MIECNKRLYSKFSSENLGNYQIFFQDSFKEQIDVFDIVVFLMIILT